MSRVSTGAVIKLETLMEPHAGAAPDARLAGTLTAARMQAEEMSERGQRGEPPGRFSSCHRASAARWVITALSSTRENVCIYKFHALLISLHSDMRSRVPPGSAVGIEAIRRQVTDCCLPYRDECLKSRKEVSMQSSAPVLA
jgi:hypothetical protein